MVQARHLYPRPRVRPVPKGVAPPSIIRLKSGVQHSRRAQGVGSRRGRPRRPHPAQLVCDSLNQRLSNVHWGIKGQLLQSFPGWSDHRHGCRRTHSCHSKCATGSRNHELVRCLSRAEVPGTANCGACTLDRGPGTRRYFGFELHPVFHLLVGACAVGGRAPHLNERAAQKVCVCARACRARVVVCVSFSKRCDEHTHRAPPASRNASRKCEQHS